MSERPIKFNAEMVRAIRDGRKTQTRRNIKYTTEHRGPINPAYLEAHKDHPGWKNICPYGKPGDTLWVSKTDPIIRLRMTDIRVERLQDISEDDAWAEGARRTDWEYEDGECCDTDREAFSHLWNTIYGPGAWDANPWVWVIEFERVKP
jgi:hypothetical protein